MHWFLNGDDDPRSMSLEDAATEFQVQGLEADWACVTWDADLRLGGSDWEYHSFVGAKWQRVHKAERIDESSESAGLLESFGAEAARRITSDTRAVCERLIYGFPFNEPFRHPILRVGSVIRPVVRLIFHGERPIWLVDAAIRHVGSAISRDGSLIRPGRSAIRCASPVIRCARSVEFPAE